MPNNVQQHTHKISVIV